MDTVLGIGDSNCVQATVYIPCYKTLMNQIEMCIATTKCYTHKKKSKF